MFANIHTLTSTSEVVAYNIAAVESLSSFTASIMCNITRNKCVIHL